MHAHKHGSLVYEYIVFMYVLYIGQIDIKVVSEWSRRGMMRFKQELGIAWHGMQRSRYSLTSNRERGNFA